MCGFLCVVFVSAFFTGPTAQPLAYGRYTCLYRNFLGHGAGPPTAKIPPYVMSNSVCSDHVHVQTLQTFCLFRPFVCSDALYVRTLRMFRPFASSELVYVQILCMCRPLVRSDHLYVRTLCMFRPFLCSYPSYVQIPCMFRPIIRRNCRRIWNKKQD